MNRYQYTDESRDELIFRIHELEDDLEGVSGELAEKAVRLSKAEDAAYRAYCIAAVGRDSLSPPDPTAPAKKGKRNAKD